MSSVNLRNRSLRAKKRILVLLLVGRQLMRAICQESDDIATLTGVALDAGPKEMALCFHRCVVRLS